MGFPFLIQFHPGRRIRRIARVTRDIERGGFEVAVHRHRVFAQKALRINRHLKDWGAVGFRSGFMFHKLDWLHDLDIEYDASTFDTDPFEPQPDGYGTIFPFWVPKGGWRRLRGVTLHATARLYPLPSPR
jgi:hypothetical protein